MNRTASTSASESAVTHAMRAPTPKPCAAPTDGLANSVADTMADMMTWRMEAARSVRILKLHALALRPFCGGNGAGQSLSHRDKRLATSGSGVMQAARPGARAGDSFLGGISGSLVWLVIPL